MKPHNNDNISSDTARQADASGPHFTSSTTEAPTAHKAAIAGHGSGCDTSSDKPNSRKLLKKRILLLAKLAIFLLVAALVSKTLISGCRDLSQHQWSLSWGWLVASGLIYLLGLLPAGLFWYVVLRRLGQDVRLGETVRAYFIGHLGKYVPGKAMVVVLRAGLIRGHTINRPLAAASVFFETLTMMAVGAFISALLLAVWFHGQTQLMLLAIGLAVAAGLPTIPPVFRMLAKMAGVGRGDPELQERLNRINFPTLLFGWFCMAVCWCLLAISLWATVVSFGGDPSRLIADFPYYLGAVSLAMVAGFLSLVPGGIGPRDGVLIALMSPFFKGTSIAMGADAAAIASALLLRIVWLVAELAISAVLYLSIRHQATSDADTDTDSPDQSTSPGVPQPHIGHQPAKVTEEPKPRAKR